MEKRVAVCLGFGFLLLFPLFVVLELLGFPVLFSGAVLRTETEAGHEDPRAAGAQGAAEVVQALNQKYRGQRLAG